MGVALSSNAQEREEFVVVYHDPYGGIWRTDGILATTDDVLAASRVEYALNLLPNEVMLNSKVAFLFFLALAVFAALIALTCAFCAAATGNKMNSATAVGQAKSVTHAAVAKEKDAIKEVKTIKVDVAKEKGYQGKVTKALADAGKVKDKFQKKLKVGYAKADVKRQTEEMKALTAQLKVKSADAKSDKAALVKDKASQKKSQAGAKAKKKLGAADKKLAALTKKVKNINTLVRKAGTV